MSLTQLILLPLLAQVLLTAIVWLVMYQTRIAEMRKKNINAQALCNSADAARLLKSVAAVSDNFSNQFEMPVLFYLAIITLYITRTADQLMLILAALYVVFRYLHSIIHITYNQVMHRFYAYLISSLILWTMWVIIAYRIT
ncbi:MAG: MAPEG family protein [Gammaproteobacteria bacterium]|nr:MAPEG family protein [Gammaproteobacteria bacterium]